MVQRSEQGSTAHLLPSSTLLSQQLTPHIVQTDGAWNRGSQTAGIGYLISRNNEQWSQASVTSFVASPLIMEGLALRSAHIKCKDLGLQM
ncbi:hypothetical protein Bca4012_039894 [Brassica carinata]|uniref:RNase H type-1 domain-containing protein n=1 Tax=Brassica carinata TaxID=52824 RepID=A0A8X7W7H6_BRACI|nr:hypothetical protein Bca52824_008126 [Brassica carinata]